MYLFWLIPGMIIAFAVVWSVYARIKRRPLSPGTPHVVVDKPSDKPAIDPAVTARDWNERSYLDWLSGRGNKA